jgi:hypothetical protein
MSAAAITFFSGAGADTKHEEAYTADALANRIRVVTAATKARLPWLKAARFGDLRTDKNSLRHDANVLACSGVEADYDERRVPFDAAVELLRKNGIAAIVYTSPSHTPEQPKWRVLCFFSAELPPAKRAHMLGRLAGLFHTIGVQFSTESWTLSQSYYYGCVNHNPEHRVKVVDGTPIDEHDDLDRTWRGKPDTAPRTGNGADGTPHSGPLDQAALREAIVSGSNYHTACVRLIGRWVLDGMPLLVAQRKIEELFDAVPVEQRDRRWKQRRRDIARSVLDIFAKEAARQDQREANAPEPLTDEPGYAASQDAQASERRGGEKESAKPASGNGEVPPVTDITAGQSGGDGGGGGEGNDADGKQPASSHPAAATRCRRHPRNRPARSHPSLSRNWSQGRARRSAARSQTGPDRSHRHVTANSMTSCCRLSSPRITCPTGSAPASPTSSCSSTSGTNGCVGSAASGARITPSACSTKPGKSAPAKGNARSGPCQQKSPARSPPSSTRPAASPPSSGWLATTSRKCDRSISSTPTSCC